MTPNSTASPLTQVRLASLRDMDNIFTWRNDPLTIATSRTQSGVDRQCHERWFPRQMANSDVVCLIGEADGEPIGVVWFRRGRARVWETSLNIAPSFRGRRLGQATLQSGMEWMRRRMIGPTFSAEIRDENAASIKTFERCGFVLVYQSPGFGTYCTGIGS